MEEIKYKYKIKVGRLWVSSFAVGYDCPFPVVDLAGSEEIAKTIESKEKAEEIADLINGVLVPIKYRVTQEVMHKWVEA
ncbi:hypothetical protein [Bacillus wiedmannii]|uniref:hypothetical protein n=1 Tax=Bacillus wiedmannii TaxID=1890302 RepID=UPI0021D03338|nr:hypothetical protein [Bacillus wiedmannii]MCU5095038.1 hypothetical protein [Bacillus wiedmannii]